MAMQSTSDDSRAPVRPRAYSLAHVAKILAVSHHTVVRLCERGEIRSIKVSPRRRIVPSDELDRILAGATPRVSSSNGLRERA